MVKARKIFLQAAKMPAGVFSLFSKFLNRNPACRKCYYFNAYR